MVKREQGVFAYCTTLLTCIRVQQLELWIEVHTWLLFYSLHENKSGYLKSSSPQTSVIASTSMDNQVIWYLLSLVALGKYHH